MIFKSNIASSEKFGRQANAQQPQSSGITSSEKMKTLPKWPLVPLMLLLALFVAKHTGAQANNYISVTGATNVYPYTTPPNIAAGATFNNFFGTSSGLAITMGAQNSIFGPNAGPDLTTGNNNTFVGGESGYTTNGSNNTYVGINSGHNDLTGTLNTALGSGAAFGGSSLTDATAIGSNATASYSDDMVFGDGNVTSWGFGMDAAASGYVMQVNCGGGVYAYLNSFGIWASSDRKLKENFEAVDSKQILDKVMALPITKWNYIADTRHLKYIGPMAQDFFATFNLGNDSTHINQSEPGDIALVAIKELGKETIAMQQQESGFVNQIQGLTSQNQALQAQNVQLQNSVSNLQDQLNTVLAEIENLKTLQAQCCGSMGANGTTGSNATPGGSNSDNSGSGQPSLAQNAPNPFSQNTVISYYLPASMPNAVITVRSLTGAMLKSFNITSPGAGQVTVNAGTLAPGTYEYDMISNNQIIDSKKMVIVGQ